jgi:hypothetical protein
LIGAPVAAEPLPKSGIHLKHFASLASIGTVVVTPARRPLARRPFTSQALLVKGYRRVSAPGVELNPVRGKDFTMGGLNINFTEDAMPRRRYMAEKRGQHCG